MKLFKCKEKSSCFQRYCLSASMRSFKVNIEVNESFIDVHKQTNVKWSPFLSLERDYKCTCCCFNRPVLKVIHNENNQNDVIGYVTDCWSCCDYIYELRGYEDKNSSYTIHGSCCQCGLCFRCPCGPCKKVDFDILSNESKSPEGCISKVWPGLVEAVFSNADSYCV